jgi:hypothetical protein
MFTSPRRLQQAGIGCLLLVLVDSGFAASAKDHTPAEFKAAWVKSIVQYATWPNANKKTPILIGVLGQSSRAVVEVLRTAIESDKGLHVDDRPLRLMDLDPLIGDSDSASVAGFLRMCDLVFFSADRHNDWIRIQPIIEDMPIITISELDGFARLGGLIELLPDPVKNKRVMVVNIDAMQRTGVSLSSKMLSLKSIVVLREKDRKK